MRVLVFCIILSLVLIEYVRLNTPATLRVGLTYEFETPAGPRSGTTVLEARRSPPIPYLPGGERGHFSQFGDAAAISLPGQTVFVAGSARYLFERAMDVGQVSPAIGFPAEKIGIDREIPAFFRALTRARATAVLDFDTLPDNVLQPTIVTVGGASDPCSVRPLAAPEFASANPGTRLARVRLAVTEEPVGRGLDALFPWLRDPAMRKRLEQQGGCWPFSKADQLSDRL